MARRSRSIGKMEAWTLPAAGCDRRQLVSQKDAAACAQGSGSCRCRTATVTRASPSRASFKPQLVSKRMPASLAARTKALRAIFEGMAPSFARTQACRACRYIVPSRVGHRPCKRSSAWEDDVTATGLSELSETTCTGASNAPGIFCCDIFHPLLSGVERSIG